MDQFRQGAGEVSLWTLTQRSWYRVSWTIYYLLELTELILPRDDFYFIRFRRNSPTVSGKDTYYTLILTECEE